MKIMSRFNFRKWLYFTLVGLRGQPLGSYYEQFLQEDRNGIPSDISEKLLVKLFDHCERSVPYYAEVMRQTGYSYHENPFEYLQHLPVLTKNIIRSQFEALKSSDLPQRKWFFNTSGGSTGEPSRFIQDRDFAARAGAIKLLFSRLAGKEIGESEIRIWGSMRDITGDQEGWRARFIAKLTKTAFLSTFRLTPQIMRDYVGVLNANRPKLIVAYVSAIYELAKFADNEGLEVVSQAAIMTSAMTLYPFMRDTIERIFKCRVYNKYGSREVGDIACERPGYEGLWIAPWGNYIEIVDSEGNRVPEGIPGEILVTSLTNYAMPLVRYRIGDRGILLPAKEGRDGRYGQVFKEVLGRTYDVFVTKDGVLFEGGYFMVLLYFRDWIAKYQVIQKSLSNITFRIVKSDSECPQAELDEIAAKTKVIMGHDCETNFEFVDEIPASGSGKFRFLISEVQRG
jgi:phenylacetate-CoA ligase